MKKGNFWETETASILGDQQIFLLKIGYNYILGSLSDKNNIFNLICIQITG